jgi:hypothetical protein
VDTSVGKYLIWTEIQGLVVSCTMEYGSDADLDYQENYKSNIPILLDSGVEYTIFEDSFIGKLDEINIRMQDKEATVLLTINNEIAYNLSFNDLKDTYELENTYNSIFVSESGTSFFDQYPFPVDFNQIKISVINNRNGQKDLKSYMIKMRRLQP